MRYQRFTLLCVSRPRSPVVQILSAVLGSCVFASGSSAETLPEALVAAYFFNPQLEAARATLRATDEDVARAKSGFRPSVTASADAGRIDSHVRPDIGTTGTTSARGYSVQISQNVFHGFRTINAINSAEASVRAERETLRATEQQVLLEAVTAYADVLRDSAILRIRETNLSFLKTQLSANRENLAVKEATRTDVAQSEARTAQGRSDLEAARTNIDSSAAEFERVVGRKPVHPLKPATLGYVLPRSLDDAVASSIQDNPQVVGALYSEQAAGFQVEVTRGELLPDAQIEASYGQRFDTDRRVEESETASIVGRITVPIYADGGEVYARIRKSKHEHVSKLQQIERARNTVKAQATQFWSQIRGLKLQMASDEAQIKANLIALDGVRAEQKVGQRTILDVLDAQRELNNSQVLLETTKRNLTVANFSMLNALGRLSIADLGLSSTVYDEAAHYAEVRDKPWGEDISNNGSRPVTKQKLIEKTKR